MRGFKKGAFSVAAKAGVDVVPITILGTGGWACCYHICGLSCLGGTCARVARAALCTSAACLHVHTMYHYGSDGDANQRVGDLRLGEAHAGLRPRAHGPRALRPQRTLRYGLHGRYMATACGAATRARVRPAAVRPPRPVCACMHGAWPAGAMMPSGKEGELRPGRVHIVVHKPIPTKGRNVDEVRTRRPAGQPALTRGSFAGLHGMPWQGCHMAHVAVSAPAGGGARAA